MPASHLQRTLIAVVLLSLLFTVLPHARVYSQDAPDAVFAAEYEPGRLLVKFKPGTPAAAKDSAKRAAGVRAASSIPQVGLEVVELPPDQTANIYRQLLHNPNVEQVSPDYLIRPAAEPTDPYYTNGSQWAPGKIQASNAWDSTSGEGVIIAIADSGVDPTHPDLVDRLVPGFNFYTQGVETPDGCGHGTHVAGIAAATANNGQGIAGIAHASRIMPIKIINDTCTGSLARMIQGIVYAADHGARVVNISSGSPTTYTSLVDAINYARSKGVVVVAAAGNYNNSDPFYPASHAETIAVAGTDSEDARYNSSNYGIQIDLAAPGRSIYSSYLNASYASMSGTSMSAPHVAGVAALVLARNPSLTAEQVEQILIAGVDDLGDPGWDPYFGHGRINAARAVAAAARAEPTPTAVPPTPTAVPTDTPTATATPTAIPTDVPPTPTATATATATPAPPTPIVEQPPATETPAPLVENSHVEAVSVSYVRRWPRWVAAVALQITDQDGRALPDATVQATWSGAYSAAVSCITDGNGVCTVMTAALVQNRKTVTLDITDVEHPALPYQPAANKITLPLTGLTYQNPPAAAALSATPLDSAMLVRWSLRDLPGVHKVALYRSASGSPDDAQPLAAMDDIAAQGGKAANEYVHTDAAVTVGETYTYWLVEMEGEEAGGELGQVTVSMGSVPHQRVFVPIISE